MNKYDGRYAFWEKYETLDLKEKIVFLTPIATNIMKDVGVVTFGNKEQKIQKWIRKRDTLIDNLIKGYDIAMEYMNAKIIEAEVEE